MRIPRITLAALAGVAALGLAGCGGSDLGPSAAGGSASAAPATTTGPVPAGSSSPPSRSRLAARSAAPSAGSRAPVSSAPVSSPPVSSPPVTPTAPRGRGQARTQAAVRAAAERFYRLYTTNRFAASWDLLTPDAQRQVPVQLWVGVHNRCPVAGEGTARVITAVTMLGNAAIVTERVAGTVSRHAMAEDVFNYSHGRWGYSPGSLGIYQHRSVAADVAAARAAGLCTARGVAPL